MIRENLRIAFLGLAANKLRSALTMLGILIGVAGVVLLLAVGAGARDFIDNQFEELGTNVVQVWPSFETESDTSGGLPALTEADVEAISDPGRAPSVAAVAATIFAQETAVAGDRTHQPQSFLGVTAGYTSITNRSTASGTLFSESDVSARRRVALIGQTVADQLFPDGGAVGQQMRVGRAQFEIIGLLERKGTGFEGDADDIILAPVTAVQDAVTGRRDSYDTLYVAAASREETAVAAAQVTDILFETHRLTDRANLDFQVFDPAELLAQAATTSAIFTALLGAIASISLLVGGIGVMNIMLVTVTERTREIGIRKAVGARRSDLLVQFLFESVAVTAVGGLLGIAIGLLGSLIRVGEFSPVVTPWSVALAFSVSVAIGLFFGIYPANRAARLRPIDALRFE